MTDPRPHRILLHPGFHKTGTSSIQRFLWANRVALSPHLGVLLLGQVREAARLCMAYSRDQNPLRLTDLVSIMDEALAATGLDPARLGPRDMIISCEGLSGNLPGGSNVQNYAAAPITIAFLAGYLAERFPDREVCVVMTTRDPEDWLRSVWSHHVVAQRQKLGWPEFRRTFQGAAQLMSIVKDISDAIAPATVFTLPLEKAATHPLGPGGALVEMAELPPQVRGALIPVGHTNAAPDARVINACLTLNQSSLPLDELRSRKAAIVAEAETRSGRRTA